MGPAAKVLWSLEWTPEPPESLTLPSASTMGMAPVKPEMVICAKHSLAHRGTFVCSVTVMVLVSHGVALSWSISFTVNMGSYRKSVLLSSGWLLLHRLSDPGTYVSNLSRSTPDTLSFSCSLPYL